MSVPGDLSSAAFHLVAGADHRRAATSASPASASTRPGSRCSGSSTGWARSSRSRSTATRRASRSARSGPAPARLRGTRGRAGRGAAGDRRAAAGRAARLLRRGRDGRRAAPPSCATRSRTGSPASSTALRALGGEVEALEDGFVVAGHRRPPRRHGRLPRRPPPRDARRGRRARLAARESEVEGFDAAAVSYPGFERDLRSLS